MCDSPLKLSKGIQFLLLAASISEGPSVKLESFPSPLEVGGYDRRVRSRVSRSNKSSHEVERIIEKSINYSSAELYLACLMINFTCF